jgi:hypothetical protein
MSTRVRTRLAKFEFTRAIQREKRVVIRFPAYEGDQEQINPGIWGKRLAEFLRDSLRKEGLEDGRTDTGGLGLNDPRG